MIDGIANINIVYDNNFYKIMSKITVNYVSYLLCESLTYTENNPHYIVGFVNKDFKLEIISAEDTFNTLNHILKNKGIL